MITSFTTGLGSTVASVGVLIALGATLGKLLADSGGADQIVDTILARAKGRAMPWAMVLIASVIGLPLFFEVGIVLLIPVVLMVAKRGNYSLMRIGIPALAGLSVMHGLIPPHPGPLVAIDAVKANLGVTLALGVLVAVPRGHRGPAVLEGRRPVGGRPGPGPHDPAASLRGTPAAPRLRPHARHRAAAGRPDAVQGLVDIVVDDPAKTVQRVFDVIGSPLIALLAAVLVGIFTLGRPAGFSKQRISQTVEKGLMPIAGILLIVGAGGGFKQTLTTAAWVR